MGGMRQVNVQNLNRSLPTPLGVGYCASFFCLLKGLSFRRHLPAEEGLLLVHPRENRIDPSIHMLGMWFPLSIVWINSEYEVVDVRLAHPWRSFFFPRRPARYVLEIAAQRIDDFKIGDKVQFEDV